MARKKEKVDTIIVSDIHLGFRFSRVKEFLEILKSYDFERLILNGDIFEDLNFNSLTTEHWQALSYLRQLSQAKKVIWIVGNHDGRAETLSHLIGVDVYTKFTWWSNGKKFLAIHGHQFDRFMHENIFISKIAEFIYIVIKRIESRSKLISGWIRKNNRNWLRISDDVAKRAARYAKLRRVNYIFCGHTHIAVHKKIKKIHYYNSGCWTEYPSNYITIKKSKVKLHEVK
ncbi:MAG: UDP-2,3-diacylglucosamine diphosphatase [bacterium]